MFEYENVPCLSTVTEMTILIQTNWWTRREHRPSKRELASIPERFRCFVCGVVKGRKHFGGSVLRQRLCKVCYPWLDEPYIGALIRWDEQHHFAQFVTG